MDWKQCLYAISTSSARGAHSIRGVLAKFVSQMLENQVCTILGDGEQSRDFTYIDNAVSANLLACHAPASHVAGL
jgi:nucleoside-diphosphate-sugar epimerase